MDNDQTGTQPGSISLTPKSSNARIRGRKRSLIGPAESSNYDRANHPSTEPDRMGAPALEFLFHKYSVQPLSNRCRRILQAIWAPPTSLVERLLPDALPFRVEVVRRRLLQDILHVCMNSLSMNSLPQPEMTLAGLNDRSIPNLRIMLSRTTLVVRQKPLWKQNSSVLSTLTPSRSFRE